MMPELFLADALGRRPGKPLFRVHTAGSVGGSTAIVASQLVQAGIHERVLTVAFREAERERGHVGALDAQSVPATSARRRRRLLRTAHSVVHGTLQGARPHRDPGGPQGPAEHAQEPLRPPPRARDHLRLHQGLDDAVEPDPLRRDVSQLRRRLRHGAGQRGGRRPERTGRSRRGQGHRDAVGADHVGRTATPYYPRGGGECAADVYKQAGITDPRNDVDCVEMYVPFSWFEPMWLENLHFAPSGEGWKYVEDGVTQLDGDLPVNMSGGVLSSNPIGASGMLRFAEAAPAGARAWPATTRSTALAPRSATPTAEDRSSSPCGSSAPRSRQPVGASTGRSPSSPAPHGGGVKPRRAASSPQGAKVLLTDVLDDDGRGRR